MWGKPYVARERGEGVCIYFGNQMGAPYISFGWQGFHGWQGSKRLRGGWAFYSPHIGHGRLFMNKSKMHYGRVLIPARLVDLWRMRDPEWRRLMKEKPQEADSERR